MSSVNEHKLSNTSNNYQEVSGKDEAEIAPLKLGNFFLQFAATISGKNIYVFEIILNVKKRISPYSFI